MTNNAEIMYLKSHRNNLLNLYTSYVIIVISKRFFNMLKVSLDYYKNKDKKYTNPNQSASNHT